MFKEIIRRELLIAMTFLATMVLVGCSNTVDSIQADILSGNYKNFKRNYEKLKLDSDKDEIKEIINDKISQIIRDFKESEKTQEVLNTTIEELNLIGVNDEFKALTNDAENTLTNIYESDEAYNKGIEFLINKEYEKAIEEFKKVNEVTGVLFIDAKQKIKFAQSEIDTKYK